MWSNLLKIKEWWNHVTEIPDLNRIIVFRIGIWKGLSVLIPDGGHIRPLSNKGFILLWKKVQKNALKKSTSEKINRIIPSLSPFWTYELCAPWNVLSRLTSRHQSLETRSATSKEAINSEEEEDLNITNSPLINLKDAIPMVKGHGLNSTRDRKSVV